MNDNQIRQVLTILKAAYPNTYKNLSKAELGNIYRLYDLLLGEYDAAIVVEALKNYIRKNSLPPTVAGLIREIDILMPNENTPMQLWQTLEEVARRASVFTSVDFKELPPPLQTWIGDCSKVKEFGQMDAATFNTVIKGQFLKTIETIIEKQKAMERLPENVKQLIGQESNRKLLNVDG